MSYTTKVFVLHKQNWKESSYIVHLLGENIGLFKGIVQGARKEKSPFFSHLELGNFLEVVILKKHTGDLFLVVSSTILNILDIMPRSYPHLIASHVALEIYHQLTIAEPEAPEYFVLLQRYLEYLPSVTNNHLLIIWRFIFKLFTLLGFPLVQIKNNRYEFLDKPEIVKIFSSKELTIIEEWLKKTQMAGNYITFANILTDTCFLVNKLIQVWFSLNLHQTIHCKSLSLYEELLMKS